MHFLIFYSFPLPFMRQIFQENIFFFPSLFIFTKFCNKTCPNNDEYALSRHRSVENSGGPTMVGGHGTHPLNKQMLRLHHLSPGP